jgi:hypothetical protein
MGWYLKNPNISTIKAVYPVVPKIHDAPPRRPV